LDTFLWLVLLADFTVFFDDGFRIVLRADVLPDRAAAGFGFALLATFFLLTELFFLVAAFLADIACTSKTGSNGTGDYTDALRERK
jgi:hypothetical protein